MTEPAGRDEILFSTVIALPSAERELYLDRACSDSDTRARVQVLLDASERCEDLILDDASEHPLDAAQAQVENYRILEDLGEGGWGTVYCAEQMSPLRREVALKIIKLGMDTKAVIIRFEAERQALAVMDHPNIAKVFDAGATDAGRPYFAMELVRGVKVTQYCDSIRATIAERVALFVQVCQAIQHAHRKGIIHRDIKPSNVMVTLCDGEAVVKVIDFGVAKAIQSGPPENTMLTVFGAFVGTPAYVSPEQMDYGARIDARSDIYSLGVLLHELLCGGTPFAPGDLSPSALHSLRSRIRSEEARLPSKFLRTLSVAAAHKVADCCRTTRSRLIGQLQGDLDWIVMRCLEKDPVKRYQSARDLSADLQRYLRDEPVVARPRRLLYSFNKFAKRHRIVFATGAAVIAALLTTSVLTSWLAVRATRASLLAQSVATFLEKDVLVQSAAGVPLRTLLDRGAEKVGARFANEPLVEAAIRSSLGTIYDSIDADREAQSQFEQALAIYDKEYGARDVRTLAAMAKVATSLVKQQRYSEAERVTLRALEHSEKVLGAKDVEASLTLSTALSLVLFEQGRIEESRILLNNDLISSQLAIFGPDHPLTLRSKLGLASMNLLQGNLGRAEALAKEVLDTRARIFGQKHSATQEAARTLREIYERAGKCSVAQDLGNAYQLQDDNQVVATATLVPQVPTLYEPYPDLWDCYF